MNFLLILFFAYVPGRDSRIHVFRLSDFEGEQNEGFVRTKGDVRDHKIEKTKGKIVITNPFND